MADESKSYRDVVSRRRFVELTGVAGAAALAGCDGDDNTGDGDGNGDDGSTDGDMDDGTEGSGEQPQYPDQAHNGVTTVDPSAIQFNPTNTENQPEISHFILYEQYAKYNYSDGSWNGAALDDWEFTGDTFEMTLREDLTWSDGSDVTADDVVTQFRIAKHDEDAVFEWASGVEKADDYTAVINVDSDVNPSLVESDVFQGRFVQQADANYGDFAEGLESGDTDISEVRDYDDNEPLTNGPFTLSDRDESVLLTEHVGTSGDADSPFASEINFGEYRFNSLENNQQRQQSLLSLEVDSDFSLTVASDVVADFPDAVEEVRIPNVFGLGLKPNHNHKHVGDRAVRQAISYVIDRQLCVDNSLPRVKTAPPVQVPISSDYQETWLGDEMDSYDDYGVDESMTDEATAVLEDAGYEMVDGTWQGPDGDTVSLPVTVPSGWNDWVLAVETAVSQLNEFGFDASVDGTGDYLSVISDPDEWVLITNTWLHGGPTPNVYYSLRHALVEPQQHHAHSGYPGFIEQYGGSNASISVPARDGSGETEVDVGQRIEDLSTTTDDGEMEEIVRELAWVANQDLPDIPILEKELQQWITDDSWDIPENVGEDSDARIRWAPTNLPRAGKLNYSG